MRVIATIAAYGYPRSRHLTHKLEITKENYVPLEVAASSPSAHRRSWRVCQGAWRIEEGRRDIYDKAGS